MNIKVWEYKLFQSELVFFERKKKNKIITNRRTPGNFVKLRYSLYTSVTFDMDIQYIHLY